MERLEVKQINGHPYYYYSKWARVDGKCRLVKSLHLTRNQVPACRLRVRVSCPPL